MYYFGDGVKKDYEIALEWFIKASKQGDMEAANRVACMYEEGIGAKKNINKAFEYYTLSATKSLSGMANLGFCYLDAKGTSQDIEKGIEWLDKASKLGNGVASKVLSEYYYNGNYVEKDLNKCYEYLEKGYKQKYQPAIYELARFYEDGIVVEKDLAKSKELIKYADELVID